MTLDNEGLSLDDLLARLQRALHIQFLKTVHGRLTASQVFVLRYLAPRERAKASEIAKITGLSPGAVTQVCDELVRLGYVERHRSDTDRRVVHLMLTDEGRDELSSIREKRAHRINHLISDLEPDQVNQFIAVLHRLVTQLERPDVNVEEVTRKHE